MSSEGEARLLPEGTPAALARLDGVLRANLVGVGARVTDVALLPDRRGSATPLGLTPKEFRRDASLRYEVLSARGGLHTTRVYEDRRDGLVAVEESTLVGPGGSTPSWVHPRVLGALLPGNEEEYAEANRIEPGASSILLSNAAWLASAAAAGASDLVARRGAGGVASDLRSAGLPFLAALALERAIEGSPTDDEEAATVVRVLTELDSGVPLEWVARRLADRS